MALKTKVVYAYDEDGYYCGDRIAQQCPTDTNQWLFPSNSIEEAVDIKKLETHFAKHADGHWVYEAKPASAAEFVGVQVSHKSQTPRNIELRMLLQALVAADSDHYRVIRGSEAEGLWWGVKAIPEPTAEEIELKEKQSRIAALKSQLAATDYVVIKIAEGAATAEEYAEVIASREAWRAEINELEPRVEELKELTK